MYFLLIWIAASVPMAFLVGRMLRGSSVPAPASMSRTATVARNAPAARDGDAASRGAGVAVAGAALAVEAPDRAAARPGALPFVTGQAEPAGTR